MSQMGGVDANSPDAIGEYEALRQTLLFLSFALMLVTACLKYRPFSWLTKSQKTLAKGAEPSDTVQSDAFQPIRTQEEIGVEDAAATDSTSRRRRVSRVVTQFAQGAVKAIRPVKSRQ
ncbi:hypothetical protein N9L47_01460 [Rhodobacteraceae bacterium]|nr:hypothetical protein [Paracoccaceae bacterium]